MLSNLQQIIKKVYEDHLRKSLLVSVIVLCFLGMVFRKYSHYVFLTVAIAALVLLVLDIMKKEPFCLCSGAQTNACARNRVDFHDAVDKCQYSSQFAGVL